MTEDKACREEFEVWARDNGYVVTRALDGKWYSQQGTDRAWDVWQGCWSRAAKPAVQDPVAVVGMGAPFTAMTYTNNRGCMTTEVPAKPEVLMYKPLPVGTLLYAAHTPQAAPKEQTPLPFPIEITPELKAVLGIPNFTTGPIAHAFRNAGYAIPPKMEEEQAFVLHWLVTVALQHGANWQPVAGKKLQEIRELAQEKKQ